MDNLGLLIRKFSVPFLFTSVGLIVLIFGLMSNQESTFMLAAGMILVAGILSLLFSLGKLKPVAVMVIGGGFGVVSIFLIVMSYINVSDSVQYREDRERCKELAKQNLVDVRFVQKIHRDQHGTYIDDWDEFVAFVKNGTMPRLISKGTVPNDRITPDENEYLYGDNRAIDNNMTEEEAYRLSKWKEGPRYDSLFKDFIRDTLQVSILKEKFMNPSYVRSRMQAGFYTFSPDSLPIIPYTNRKWDIKTRDSVTVGESSGPSLYIEGTLPFAEIEGGDKKIKMTVGNINTLDLQGSWEKDK